MSNFGGQKPGAWNRPPGQMQGFPGVNVGGFSMMGVGVPMGMVNQAAFSQPNLLGMAGLVGGVQQAPLGQQVRPPAPVVPQNNQNMNGQQGKSHRTFVGTVTKMLDNYGFVDDDIFFQLGVISGAQPRVGEKVMVQASFNPNMPFKWNAHKISLIGNNVPIPQDAGRIEPPQHTSRWGAPSGHNERDRERSPSVRSSPPRHRRPSPRRSPPRKTSPKRERRRSPAPRARSPRRSPIRDNRKRDREKSPIHKDKVSSVRKASSSPPRRRARIIPRYEFRNIKEIPVHSLLTSNAVRLRYSKLYIPSDFVDLNLDWITGMPLESNTSFSNSIQFHVLHKDVEIPSGIDDELPPLEPDDADSRHQVKVNKDIKFTQCYFQVLLLSHAGDVEILKKAFCLQPDGSTDENEEPQSFLKNLHFLTGTRGKEMMPIGGCWSPSLDGEDPESPVTLIKTAIRTTRAMTGVDLSLIPQWYSLARVRYYRSDKTRMDTVHLLFPDTQLLAPDDESWVALQQMIADQLKQKLAEVDALCLPPEEPEPTPETTTTIPVVTKDGTQTEDKTEVILLDDNKSGEAILLVEKVEEAKEQLAEAKTEETANAAVDDAAADKKEETAADVEMKNDEVVEDEASLDASMNESDIDKVLVHWSKIDVKMLKVTELRKQLEERKLETKGIKSLLVQRLQTALDAEKKKEEEKEVPVVAEVTENKEEEVTEVMEVQEDDIQVLEVIEKPEKSATELRNEENERKKKEVERKQKEEKLEKEKKEKREALERHYKLPTDKKILVFPSKVAKSGKFDCKVVSIDTLLGYRIDDNKEHSFEVAIYVEAIREFFERKFAFNIYRSIANSADKDSEKAKREEAAKKPKVIEVVDLEADEPVTVTPAEAAAATTTTPTTPPAAVVAPAASTESPEVKPLVDVKFEKIELKSVVHDRVLYMSFAYYDSSLTGYLLEKDVEALLGAAEFGLTRALIQKTLKKQSTRDKINYRNLTDVLQDSDGLVRYTPGVAEEIVADETLVRGYGIKLLESTEKPASSDKTAVQDASDGNVIVNGSIVNVPLKLKLLQSAETERDAIKSKLNEMQSLIEQLRESKSDMEKKKNQAEKDYEKTKKKLSETTASLKTAKEEVDTLKSAVSDFRKYATRILSIADKVDPPPKPASPVKEKVEKESKVEEVIMLDEIEDEPSAKTDETRKKEKSTEAPVVEASKPAEKEDDVIMLDTEEKTDA